MKKIKVDIIFDFQCPFCFVGHDQFLKATKLMDVDFEINYIPYSLQLQDYNSTNTAEVLATKYNISINKANENIMNMQNYAANVGLEIDFSKILITDSRDAMNLVARISSANKSEIINEIFIDYYMGRNDLSTEMVSAVISKYDVTYYDVSPNVDLIAKFNVQSIPSYIINDETFVQGSNTKDGYVEILNSFL